MVTVCVPVAIWILLSFGRLLFHQAGHERIYASQGKIRPLAGGWGVDDIKVLESVVGLGSAMIGWLVSMLEYFMSESEM